MTLYNVKTAVDTSTFRNTVENNITVLRKVLIASVQGADATERGKKGSDAVKLYVPFGAVAVKDFYSPRHFEVTGA